MVLRSGRGFYINDPFPVISKKVLPRSRHRRVRLQNCRRHRRVDIGHIRLQFSTPPMVSPPFLFTAPSSRCRRLASRERRSDIIGIGAKHTDSTGAAPLTQPQMHASPLTQPTRHSSAPLAWPQPGGKEAKCEACERGVASRKSAGSPAKERGRAHQCRKSKIGVGDAACAALQSFQATTE